MTAQQINHWPQSGFAPSLHDARIEDAEQLAALHVACWRETYEGLVDPQILAGLSIGDRTASWKRLIESSPPTGRILLVEAGGDLVGFGAVGAQRNNPLARQGYDGEISALYLRASWQGIGLGRRLFATLATSLLDRGFRSASLWVLADNHRAVGFYRHLGGVALDVPGLAPSVGGAPEIALGWRDLTAFPL
jgi:ribosomal protein S18 acetylase RimI-like enzyme